MQYSSWKSNFWVGSRVYLRISRISATVLQKRGCPHTICIRGYRDSTSSIPILAFHFVCDPLPPQTEKYPVTLGYQCPKNTQIAVLGETEFSDRSGHFTARRLRVSWGYLALCPILFKGFFVLFAKITRVCWNHHNLRGQQGRSSNIQIRTYAISDIERNRFFPHVKYCSTAKLYPSKAIE